MIDDPRIPERVLSNQLADHCRQFVGPFPMSGRKACEILDRPMSRLNIGAIVLKNLQHHGVIELVEKGKGNKPSTYRYIHVLKLVGV